MPLWGGCDQYLTRGLQMIQNKAARVVTNLDWYTPTQVLLSQCGWLSVHQLSVYHSVVLVYKVLSSGQPLYLNSMFNQNYSRRTRQADMQLIRPSQTRAPSHELALDSFRWRALQEFNSLPLHIRSTSSLAKFKKLVKVWIMEQVPIM